MNSGDCYLTTRLLCFFQSTSPFPRPADRRLELLVHGGQLGDSPLGACLEGCSCEGALTLNLGLRRASRFRKGCRVLGGARFGWAMTHVDKT